MCKIKLGYEFCYLYTALAPATGSLISLILPDMSKGSFGIFADYFREQVHKLCGNKEVVLIANKAGSHQVENYKTRGVALELLPRACPELNPVERFFGELRKGLSDLIFKNIDEVENHLCMVLRKYYKHPKHIVQLCYYPYMQTT